MFTRRLNSGGGGGASGGKPDQNTRYQLLYSHHTVYCVRVVYIRVNVGEKKPDDKSSTLMLVGMAGV